MASGTMILFILEFVIFDDCLFVAGFVMWAMKVIRKYSSQFYRVVFKKRKVDDWEEIGNCFEITKAYSKEVLEPAAPRLTTV